MAIQFSCTGCDNQLSVPETAAGKKARCPKCSTVVVVPDGTPADGGFPGINTGDEYAMRPPETPAAMPTKPASSPTPQRPAPFSDNPYASPTMGYDEPLVGKPGTSGIRPTLIDFGDILSHGWRLYMQNVGMVLGAVMLAYVINMVLNWVIGFMSQIVIAVIGDNDLAVFVIIPFQLFIYLVQIAISTFLNIGVWRILLDVGKGQRQDFGKLFSGGDIFLPMFAATLLWLLMLIPATILLIIPGIIVLILFGQWHFLMLDQGMGVMESFSMSLEITKNNWLALLGIYTISLLIAIACGLACFLPLIFFGPYISMVWCVMYLKMTGQHVAPA